MSTAKLTNNVGRDNIKQGMKVSNVRKLTVTAMLAAVATVLMSFDFPVPFMPPFIKMDVSELPAVIASFTLGPVSGVVVCLVKNLINLLRTQTGGVGELCNFLLGASFVIPAGYIYQKVQSRKGAIIGAFTGCIAMALFSVVCNYYLVYPVYTKFMSMDAILSAYQVINPRIETLLQALVVFNMPFTFVKGLFSVVITGIIYKPLSPIIRGQH